MGRLLNRHGGFFPMSDNAVPPGTPQEVALQTILRSIAVRDRSTAARLLAGSPALARQALDVGATRAQETDVGPNRFTTRWMGLRGRIPGIQRRNMPLSSS